jgi:hypothetical protein
MPFKLLKAVALNTENTHLNQRIIVEVSCVLLSVRDARLDETQEKNGRGDNILHLNTVQLMKLM